MYASGNITLRVKQNICLFSRPKEIKSNFLLMLVFLCLKACGFAGLSTTCGKSHFPHSPAQPLALQAESSSAGRQHALLAAKCWACWELCLDASRWVSSHTIILPHSWHVIGEEIVQSLASSTSKLLRAKTCEAGESMGQLVWKG